MKNKSLLYVVVFVGMSNSYAGQGMQKKTTTAVKNDSMVKVNMMSTTKKNEKPKTLSNLMADINLSSTIEIRFIDSFEVMGNCKEGVQARHDLEVKREVLSQELQKEEQKITQTMSEYKGKSSMLSDTAREKEEKGLMRMERGYKAKIQDSEEELKIDMQKKTENLARNVDKAVIKVAKEEKLDAIVDKATGRVIYVDEKFDFTFQVKSEMNKQYDIRLAQNKKELNKFDTTTIKTDTTKVITV